MRGGKPYGIWYMGWSGDVIRRADVVVNIVTSLTKGIEMPGITDVSGRAVGDPGAVQQRQWVVGYHQQDLTHETTIPECKATGSIHAYGILAITLSVFDSFRLVPSLWVRPGLILHLDLVVKRQVDQISGVSIVLLTCAAVPFGKCPFPILCDEFPLRSDMECLLL